MRLFYLLTPVYSLNTRYLVKRQKHNMTPNVLFNKPKTDNQIKYNELLNNDKIKIVISVGSSGTGKTMFACQSGISKLTDGLYDKILITRPVVSVDEDIGFLPGSLNKKMTPWIRPILDIFTECNYEKLSTSVEISPLGFMRGRTFKNFYIVADEMQNSTPSQMIMLLTRMGENSKMVITGDLKQSDNMNMNGLKDLIEKMNNYYDKDEEKMNKDGIGIVYFNDRDIQRSVIVSNILSIYSKQLNKID